MDGIIYRPLDASRKEIRVLSIEPQLDSHDRLVCDFEVVSLIDENVPQYSATSWCWGETRSSTDIVLSRYVVEIPSNAAEVLKRVCYDQQHYRAWIDAVCINQKDIVERGDQVAITQDVYSQAQEVLIWLGEDPGVAEVAFQSVDMLVTQMREAAPSWEALAALLWDVMELFQLSDELLPECDWLSVAKLFSARWFTRVWCVQEVVLSKAGLCFWGDYSRSWSDLSSCAIWLHHRSYWRSEYLGHQLYGINNAGQIWFLMKTTPDLGTLLAMSTDLQATLPIDKVYGVLGMAPDGHQIRPDYKKDLKSVYAAATRAAIHFRHQERDQLSLLAYASAPVPPSDSTADDVSWPSWVPHFHWPIDSDRGSAHSVRTFTDNGPSDRRAAVIIPQTTPDSLYFTLKGVIVDKVDQCFERTTSTFCDGEQLPTQFLRYRTLARSVQRSEIDIAFTMTCGINHHEADAILDREFYHRYKAFRTECLDRTDGISWSKDAFDYIKAIWAGSTNRRFFLTSSHHLIGMGSSDMQADDRLCIFFGGEVPFICRPDGDSWKLVGSAYVYALMDGTWIQELEENNRLSTNTTTFRLV